MAYAEPLIYKGLVFVATENDSVYALNDTTGAVVWRTHIGTPVQGSSLPCGNISPSGITGTPVIDTGTDTIYVVAFESPATMHYLVALSITDGKVVFSHSADPPGADPRVQQERGALSLGNGMVYVPYGGLDGDCGQYHGWVAGINTDGSGSMVSYQVPTGREGGIWAPSGGVTDSTGNLFFATGNGASSNNFDHGNAVVKLSPTLQELDYFAPSNWLQLNNGDTDLGSVGPLLVGHNQIFQIGKEGVGYLLDATNLGGIGGQVYSGDVCSSVYGGTATAGSTVFVPCTDGLVALSLSPNSFQVLWRSPGFPSGPPIVTGNVVWALDTSSGTLHGYDVKTGTSLFSLSTGSVTRFTTPATGDGQVFVAAGSKIFAFQIS
jgi:outer membrane protein assembly factor BamB